MSEWTVPEASEVVARLPEQYRNILPIKGDIASVFGWAMYISAIGDVVQVLTNAQAHNQSLEEIRLDLVQALADVYVSINTLIHTAGVEPFQSVIKRHDAEVPEPLPIANITELVLYDLDLVIQIEERPVSERFLYTLDLFRYDLDITLRELDEASHGLYVHT